jgi:gluconolactonase
MLGAGLAFGLGLGQSRAAQPPAIERLDPALDAVLDVDTPVERVVSGAFEWCEGPVWIGGANGFLLASDPRANRIIRYQPGGGASVWLAPSGLQEPADPAITREAGTNGLALGRGGLIAADSGSRAIVAIDLATKARTILAARFEGKRFNSPNDLVVSPTTGQIFFTDPAYGLTGMARSPSREMDYMGVFRLDPDNSVALLGKYAYPNGIGISPDGRTLYITDARQGWLALALDETGGKLSERPFIDLKAEKIARPAGDGLKVDSTGKLWLSGDGGISIFNPQGHRLGRIRVADPAPNCEIGADGNLYIANGDGILRVPVRARKIEVTDR